MRHSDRKLLGIGRAAFFRSSDHKESRRALDPARSCSNQWKLSKVDGPFQNPRLRLQTLHGFFKTPPLQRGLSTISKERWRSRLKNPPALRAAPGWLLCRKHLQTAMVLEQLHHKVAQQQVLGSGDELTV